MRGGAAPGQQPRRREHENAGAERQHPRAAGVRLAQRPAQGVGHGLVRAAPTGHHNRAGAGEQRRAAVHLDPEPAGGAERARLQRRHAEAVPVLSHLRPREAEDLHRDAELEGAEAVVGERDHQAVGAAAARGGAALA